MNIKIIEELQKKSKKRKFIQTYELIVNLKKEYDLNKSENRITEYLEIPNPLGKKLKVCAIVGPELEKMASNIFDEVITKDKMKELNKREAKKLVRRNYHFVAQISVMPDVGRYLGKYLSVKDKMPNPKFGLTFPDNADEKFLTNLYNKLQKTVRVVIKRHITFGIPIGTENLENEKVLENAKFVLDWLNNKIGKENIRSVYLKLTMSEAVKIL